VVLVVLALPCMPCLLIVIVQLDDVWEGTGRALRRRRRRRREERDARHLLRAAGVCRPLPWQRSRLHTPDVAVIAPLGPVGPPIERIAADLRRLAVQRVDLATRSPVWFSAVQRAYDDRLTVACRELEISQHLAELTGVDLDIERVRVEGMLNAAGLAFHDTEADRA
jgi:hypothetical protein